MAVLKETSSNVQSNRPADDKENRASRNDRQTTVLDEVDSLTVSRNLDMQNSLDQDRGAKWSDTESTASSETSSGSSSPSTYHQRYRRIPSQASSISLSVPSAESSAFPSRATSLTNISIVSDELSLGPPVENESSLIGLGVQNLDPSFTDPAKTFGIQFEAQAPRSGNSDESEPSSVQAKDTADEDIHECLTDVEQQGNVNSEEQGGSVDVEETQPEEQEKDDDPWNSIPNFGTSNRKKWSDLTTCGKIKRVLLDYICKPLAAFTCLYFFIVALDLMGDAFTLIGGSAAGAALSDSTLLENPIVGLMIGMLVTVLLQSSSGTTSIIVSMVAADIIQVQEAIPMVMGANLGTSVTNTIVAGGQAGDRETFRLSFAGATVHDCFNWLAVLILLPLECVSGYLYHLTSAIVNSSNLHQISGTNKMSITSPIVDLIIQLDMSVLEKVALGELEPGEESLVDRWCIVGAEYNGTVFYEYDELVADYYADYNTTATVITDRCNFLFAYCDLPDEVIGAIILVFSLILLMACLLGIVKLLSSMLRGSTAVATRKFLNADFPGRLSWLTGYLSILVGCLFTMLLQSSSVFTSLLTPLVGMGIITVDRMYPLTLGSNIGTTFTSLLAAFASSSSVDFVEGVQISLCHLFFNLSGILLWYPIPITRRPPLGGAKFLGNTTAKYRWFSVAYILTVFFIIPAIVLVLSILGWQYLALVMSISAAIIVFVIVVNILQNRYPKCLPKKMRTWDFLPKFMRSLEPYDNLISKCAVGCRKCKKKCGIGKGDDASDSEQVSEGNADNLDVKITIVCDSGQQNEAFSIDEERDSYCEIQTSTVIDLEGDINTGTKSKQNENNSQLSNDHDSEVPARLAQSEHIPNDDVSQSNAVDT